MPPFRYCRSYDARSRWRILSLARRLVGGHLIGMLCLCPLVSLGISILLERDPSIIMPAFVPLKESRSKTRFAPLFKIVCIAYGIVFGVGIGRPRSLSRATCC